MSSPPWQFPALTKEDSQHSCVPLGGQPRRSPCHCVAELASVGYMGLLQGLVDTVCVVGWQETQQPGTCDTRAWVQRHPAAGNSHGVEAQEERDGRTQALLVPRPTPSIACNTGISPYKMKRDPVWACSLPVVLPFSLCNAFALLGTQWCAACGNWSDIKLPALTVQSCVLSTGLLTLREAGGNSQRGTETKDKMKNTLTLHLMLVSKGPPPAWWYSFAGES